MLPTAKLELSGKLEQMYAEVISFLLTLLDIRSIHVAV